MPVSRFARSVSRLASFLALGTTAAVALNAPKPVRLTPESIETLSQAADVCRASELEGWDLVEFANQLVSSKYSFYSVWHVWESPEESFINSRGHANQYNQALGRVLEALGFDVTYVHAARVRLDRNPWWHAGHTWVRVTIEGRTLDVCASKPTNRPGQVAFTPVTPVRPFRTITKYTTTVALYPIVVTQICRAWLDREEVPRWIYRPFGESA